MFRSKHVIPESENLTGDHAGRTVYAVGQTGVLSVRKFPFFEVSAEW